MNKAIVWFRRDLRVADHPALHAACAAGFAIEAVYIHAPEEEGEWKPGAAANWWLHHSLVALEQDLRALGIRLRIMQGSSLTCLQRLAAQVGADSVYWNRRYEPLVMARDREIKSALRDAGRTVHTFNGALLFEPWEAQTLQGGPYRVFTPFWRSLVSRTEMIFALPVPESPVVTATPDIAVAGSFAIDDLGLLPKIRWDSAFADGWKPGAQGAQIALNTFLAEAVADYKHSRDIPSRAGTSRLSPFLAWGNISPRQILVAIRDAQRSHPKIAEQGAAYVRELGWREFSWHLLYHFPHTTNSNLNPKFAQFPWAEPDRECLAAWQQGQTGIPLVDAGMRELWSSGWMHNRVRMIVASFLTKNLRYHWIHGARWFWDTLVDADLANNTMGWQWAAGTGADAAPYFRVFNPVLQGERFDPKGSYVRAHIPQLRAVPERWVHQPWMVPLALRAKSDVDAARYPEPIVSLAATRQAALAAYASAREG